MWHFPLEECSGIPVEDHPGAFGVQRKYERHTGVDLYTHDGELIYAVESGVVVGIEPFTGAHDNSPWWNDTFYILIEGQSGVICYGEIANTRRLQVGESVMRGQVIANVKRVLKDLKGRDDIPGHSTSMLHIEKYPHGTTKAANGFDDTLQDPTPQLTTAEHWNGIFFTKTKWYKLNERRVE